MRNPVAFLNPIDPQRQASSRSLSAIDPIRMDGATNQTAGDGGARERYGERLESIRCAGGHNGRQRRATELPNSNAAAIKRKLNPVSARQSKQISSRSMASSPLSAASCTSACAKCVNACAIKNTGTMMSASVRIRNKLLRISIDLAAIGTQAFNGQFDLLEAVTGGQMPVSFFR